MPTLHTEKPVEHALITARGLCETPDQERRWHSSFTAALWIFSISTLNPAVWVCTPSSTALELPILVVEQSQSNEGKAEPLRSALCCLILLSSLSSHLCSSSKQITFGSWDSQGSDAVKFTSHSGPYALQWISRQVTNTLQRLSVQPPPDTRLDSFMQNKFLNTLVCKNSII